MANDLTSLPIEFPIDLPIDQAQLLLLGLALLLALGFEFVNGFHDTANAVATVIYTQSLKPIAAVVWSGLWNLIGVLTSTGTVAFSIVALLPVELVLNVGSSSGWAMVFALLLAAILWNLGTWYLGLPASSSHALIGSILGVGFAQTWLTTGAGLSDGINWSKTQDVLIALLTSPLIGFSLAALLFGLTKVLVRQPELYEPPQPDRPPPLWIRLLLILTCTGVSFAHGSNDGQKGMGLIGLILVGILPGFYAINPQVSPEAIVQLQVQTAAIRPMFEQQVEVNPGYLSNGFYSSFATYPPLQINPLPQIDPAQSISGSTAAFTAASTPAAPAVFPEVSAAASLVPTETSTGTLTGTSIGISIAAMCPDLNDATIELTRFLQSDQPITPQTFSAIARLQQALIEQLDALTPSSSRLTAQPQTLRTQLYLVSGALNKLIQLQQLPADLELSAVQHYRQQIDNLTQFIPIWVKIAVASALGSGTMIGWKRIVTTVGEKIGQTHLTYAQGGAAELVAMGTIVAADGYGLPVSTTHVLSSGVAGTMVANQSGVQMNTIRQIVLAWVLTLPCCMVLSGLLFMLFSLLIATAVE